MSTAQIRSLSPEPNVTVERITPEKAREYLGFNTHNRSLRPRVVTAYAADMAAGDWLWNGEGIKFAADGTLLDGQHRLAAIVQADVPIRMLVIRDLPDSTQETMDGGVKRKFADVLKLRGETDCVALAATLRAIASYGDGSNGIGDTGRSFTNAQMLQTLERYPWVREGMPVVRRAQAHAAMPSSVSGLSWFLFVQIDTEDCEHFFNRLCSDENHHQGEPIYALRRLLLSSVDGVRGDRNKRFLTAVTIKSWNKYRDGEPLEQLKFRVGGAKPETFPAPH